VSDDNLFVETGAYIRTASSSTFYSPDRYQVNNDFNDFFKPRTLYVLKRQPEAID